MNTKNIYDIPFYDGTKEDVIQEIKNRIDSDQSTVVFTPNGEILYRAKHDPVFKGIIQQADICIPDGISVIKVSERLGRRIKEKIAGVELGLELIQQTSLPTFLLGAKPGYAEEAKIQLEKEQPSIHIVGTHHGYFSKTERENIEVIEQINQSQAKILFVCFGSPSQEEWIINNKDSLPNIKVFLGLGGSIDIYAKKAKRAPAIFLKLKIEWLYRIGFHPKRFMRSISILKLLHESAKHK